MRQQSYTKAASYARRPHLHEAVELHEGSLLLVSSAYTLRGYLRGAFDAEPPAGGERSLAADEAALPDADEDGGDATGVAGSSSTLSSTLDESNARARLMNSRRDMVSPLME